MAVKTTYPVLIIAFLIVILNSILLLGFKKKYRRGFTTYDFFLVSFTIANLIQGVFTYPFVLYTLVSEQNKNHWQCIIAAVLMLNCSVSTIWHLIILSFERFFSLKYPLFYAKHNKSRLWRGIGVSIPWLSGCFWSFPPLFGWNRYDIEFQGRPDCNIDLRDHSKSGLSYLYSLFVFNYIVPIMAFAFTFYHLRIELKKISKMARRAIGVGSKIAKASMKTEKTQTILIIIMVVSFMVAWTPYSVLVFYRTAQENEIEVYIYELSAILAKTSCIFNPIIYGLVYKDIRDAILKSIVGKKRRNNRVSILATETDILPNYSVAMVSATPKVCSLDGCYN
uniref:Opsin n=1 Tax=Cladonema radiatum TaxID=264074 RepID=A9CR18_9CNID|nr:opsin [Cladonema radiatum]